VIVQIQGNENAPCGTYTIFEIEGLVVGVSIFCDADGVFHVPRYIEEPIKVVLDERGWIDQSGTVG
jgi:hypothetical protein